MEELFYRYTAIRYAGSVDECGDYSGSGRLVLECEEYTVIKRTEKSVLIARKISNWIEPDNNRWVRLESRNVFAAPTKKEALFHFIKRKERQTSILSHQLQSAKEAKAEAESLMERI